VENIQKSQIFILTQTQNSKNYTKGNLGKISTQTQKFKIKKIKIKCWLL
jgi:hypothetical protein